MTFYALVELMGHAKIVGFASWHAGGVLRIEPILRDGSRGPTQNLGPGALFRVFSCTQDVAMRTAASLYDDSSAPLPAWAETKPFENPEERNMRALGFAPSLENRPAGAAIASWFKMLQGDRLYVHQCSDGSWSYVAFGPMGPSAGHATAGMAAAAGVAAWQEGFIPF